MSFVLPAPLEAQRLAQPERIALCDGSAAWTFDELGQTTQRLMAWYQARGVGVGSCVALCGRASAAFVVHMHALMGLGAELVPIPPAATSAELEHLGTLAEFALAVALDEDVSAQPQALGAPQAARGPELATLAPADVVPQALDVAQPLVRVSTSGTSGPAKLVALSVGQVFASAVAVATRIGHLPGDRWLLTLPLHHVGGLAIVWRAVWLGAAVELALPFDAAHTAGRLQSGAVTLGALVPTMLARVVEAWPEGHAVPPQLRAVVLGGAPTPPKLARAALTLGLPVAVSWGMTEAGSQIATRFAGEDGVASDVGPPLPLVQVSVAQPSCALEIDGPQAGGRKITTRDAGTLEGGRVHVWGRLDDLIISGGENIAPEEIEQVLLQHARISDAGVVAAPDEEWGQRPVAYLVATDEAEPPPTDDELRAFCRARLASFKIPRAYVWLRALPRDALGKLRRRALCAPS